MHPYPKHFDAFEYLGHHRYFLTFCTHERQPLFASALRVAFVEAHFLRVLKESGFEDLAHCFMPDHLHTAVEGTLEQADLRAFVSKMKQYSGFYFKKEFGVRLWQRYGYEHVIRRDEQTRDVIRYVLENPVRAGLVRTVAEYPYIGSSEFTLDSIA